MQQLLQEPLWFLSIIIFLNGFCKIEAFTNRIKKTAGSFFEPAVIIKMVL